MESREESIKKDTGHDGWQGVDLDGTLAKQATGAYDPDAIGEPVKPMLLFVKSLLKKGEKVKIFTARAYDKSQIPLIQDWLEEQGLPRLEVTNVKTPNMIALYDDRAYHVEHNMGKIIK